MIKYHVLTAFIAGVTITCAAVGMWRFLIIEDQVRLLATIRAVPWKSPVLLIDVLKNLENIRDPNLELIILRGEYPQDELANYIQDIKSMYIIDIFHKGIKVAKDVQISIPGAIITEISWASEKGLEMRVVFNNELVSLPDLHASRTIRVIAWTTQKPTKENAEEVLITQEQGWPAKIMVEAPLGTLARLINNTLFFVIILSIFFLLIISLAWSRWKRKMLQIKNVLDDIEE